MRLQFAIFEAIIAISIALSLVSYYGFYLMQMPNQFHQAKSELSESILEYDFINNLHYNQSQAACLKDYIANDSGCLKPVMSKYNALYGTNLTVINGFSENSAYSNARCFLSWNNTYQVCFGDV